MGRPTVYTQEIGDAICARVPHESLRVICKDLDISMSALMEWARTESAERPGFVAAYARARADQVEALADEILEISDESSNDFFTDENGHEHVNHEAINRSRLRVDSRKWLLSKLAPKKYGDRLELAGDKENPLVVQQLTAAETIRRKRQERLKGSDAKE